LENARFSSLPQHRSEGRQANFGNSPNVRVRSAKGRHGRIFDDSLGRSCLRIETSSNESESVEEALSTVTERIEAINRDPRAKFSIRKAVAFGDFLSERAQVQAADVGVMLTRRTPPYGNQDDKEEQAFMKQLQAKNRFVHAQRYQPWMGDRTHRKLL
jgi:hypothetical protein